jgi:hypothetical protein
MGVLTLNFNTVDLVEILEIFFKNFTFRS